MPDMLEHFFTYWYLHLPSLVLAVFIYLLIGRLAAVALPARGEHGDARAGGRHRSGGEDGRRHHAARGAVPLVIVFAIMWLLSARILLHQALVARRMFG